MIKYVYLFILFLCSGAVGANSRVDPTQPQDHRNKMLSTEQDNVLSLSAIFITDKTRQAIINGLSYAEGQAILAYKVVSINANTVELIGPQGTQVLFINNNNVKKDADNGF